MALPIVNRQTQRSLDQTMYRTDAGSFGHRAVSKQRIDVRDPSRPSEAIFLDRSAESLSMLRKSLGLSRFELARRCGLSESTIRNVETGRHSPTAQTLAALATILPWIQSPADSTGHLTGLLDGGPLCLLGQQDCLQSHQQLLAALRGEGGYLSLSLLLCDPACAIAFAAFRNQSGLQRQLWQDVAKRIRGTLGRQPLDMWAIACADGRKEVALCEWLLACGLSGLRLLLMEQSVPLLSTAYQHALMKLGREPEVQLGGLQADLQQLPRYRLGSQPRRQLFCLLGPLLGLPDGELWSLQQALLSSRRDDLLLLGFESAIHPPGQAMSSALREQLMAPDPLLRAFVERPFRLHLPDVQRLTVSTTLDVARCAVPASYAVDLRASVTTKDRSPRRYTVWRSNRYHPQTLTESLQQEGWKLLQGWQDEKMPATGLHLYQRVRVDDPCASEGPGSYQTQAHGRSQTLWTDPAWDLCQPISIQRNRRRLMTLCRAVEHVRCQPVQPRSVDAAFAVGKRVARLAYLLL